MNTLSFLFVSACLIPLFSIFSNAADTITQSQPISDGSRTLVSKDGSFELGFFSPGSSTNRYLGIWYKNIPVQTVVWVANRNNPIRDTSGVLSLMINSSATLVLLTQNSSAVWSANSTKEAQNPIIQLLDSGNLVLRDEKDENPENYLWQSFDYPCDTLLPGMKLGWDFTTGLERRLSAWKSSDDPSPGDFSWGIELTNYPEAAIWKGSEKFFRSGPWNGLGTSGAVELRPNPVFNFSFVSNEDEVYYTFNLINKSVISRIVLNQTYYMYYRYYWNEADRIWMVYAKVPRDQCDNYGICGVYGNCIISQSPSCQCLKGFKPKSPENWNLMDWSQGCVRRQPLNCQDKAKDGFNKFVGIKMPDTTHSWVNKSMTLKECREKCLNNCTCMAYTNSDIRGGGSGCTMWFGDLIDIRNFAVGGQDLYIRMPASELEVKGMKKVKIAVIIVAAIAFVSGMLLVGSYIHRSRAKFKERKKNNRLLGQNNEDLPLFNLSTIATATDNFSIKNKLGEGGFGPVYRGVLADGKEIAVKRLSQTSGQGFNELKNEVILIAKLQHRNLVKLLGCCIQGEEKLLIYEYMPNRSLDSFIFDETRDKQLDWPKRLLIISGIARGLLYLHQDSRLRIIHRDLKASNVLLDNEMNPKISDFGIAKTFGGDQSEGNTKRVVGTYGYMAPEYAYNGLFSTKSDVFSYGILLLEIVTGKKNRVFSHPDHSLNLIGHAWIMWKEGRTLELIDAHLRESCTQSEVLRCVHVGLLCVQQNPEDRPSMSSVVLMLGSENALPAQPKQPGFFIVNSSLEADSSSSKQELPPTTLLTITGLEAR